MSRKPVMFLTTLALATVVLAGCGGDPDDGGDAAEPTTASEEATTQEEPTTAEEPTATEEGPTTAEEGSQDTGRGAPTDSAADQAGSVDDIDAPDPGPAPEGAVIAAEAVAKPPQAIGPFSLGDGSGPALMYSDEVSSVLISVGTDVLSSPYEQLVESIETDNTPAGTGSCGTNETGSSITCYQRVDDGVITMNAIPEEISLEDMVVFVNHFAEQAGAA